MTARELLVTGVGPLATVQDLGRAGYAGLGVPASGAADLGSHLLANRLVGNPAGSATIEVVLGGLRLRAGSGCTIAFAGAPAPVRVGGRAASTHAPLPVRAGESVELGTPPSGLRTYCAVRGGFAVESTLGSRSTDTLSGLGPPPLAPGMKLPVGEPAGPYPGVDLAPVPDLVATAPVTVLPGPRDDWFAPDALRRLAESDYVVSADCDRIGVRLEGPTLDRRIHRELKSEGMVRGAIQVPPDGGPIVFLADHPVTGGYPVIAVVADRDVDRIAQARPGDRIRFAVR